MAGAASPPLTSAGSAVLLVSSVALLAGTAVHRAYSADVLALLVVLAGLLLGGLLLGGAFRRPPSWAVVLGGLLGVVALAVAPPVQYVISNGWLLVGVLVLAAAGAVPVLLPLVRPEPAGWVAGAGLAVAAAGFGLVILGSTPVIDVWVLLQGAGHGLAGGRNPYELSFPDSPPGQVRDCFTYLPATMLLTAPGVWLGGDARWAELVLLVGTGAALCWHLRARGGTRLALALLVVVLPGAGYLVQQAWTETVVLPALVGTAVLADRGRTGWAAVAFGVALASKQHILLLAPLLLLCRLRPRELAVAAGTSAALTLPWLLANPSRFVGCTVTLFLNAPPRADSLSLWLTIPEPARLPVLVLGLLVGYLLAWRCCPRTGAGFLVGAAVVLGGFGLVNKQTFLNQWWLVGALVVAGLALTPSPRASATPDGVENPDMSPCHRRGHAPGATAHSKQRRDSGVISAAGSTSPPQTVVYRPRATPALASSTVTRCAVPLTSTIWTVPVVGRGARSSWRRLPLRCFALLCRPIIGPPPVALEPWHRPWPPGARSVGGTHRLNRRPGRGLTPAR